MIAGEFDVVVIGAGNAGMCAALAARGEGARVLVLEAAPFDERGGNSRFTAGALRFVYNGVDDLLKLCDLSETELATSDFGTYTTDQYYDDLGRLTDYRSNPDMAELLVTKSQETLLWMRSQGIRFAPMYSRQAFKHEGKFVFWGGLALEAWGGGPGLVEGLFKAAEERQIQVAYEARGEALIADDDGVHGVVAKVEGKTTRIPAKAVILASGGFEANAEMRTRYLGPGWDLAKVRGTRFNTGAGIKMALDIGAMPYGNWSGCHAVGWDYNAPEFGDLAVGDNFQKHSYPFAIMVNADGVRFCDEGADFRNYTYAKYGREILNQPHQFAWQIFDQQVVHLQRDEYRIRQVTKVTADTIEGLADKMAEYAPVDKARFLETVREYNAAVQREIPYNPTVKDGRTTKGLAINKTNWAMPIEKPPFEAYCTTCGVTFTFGGLRIDTDGRVLDTAQKADPRPLCRGRARRWALLFQLPRRDGPGFRVGIRQNRRDHRRHGSPAALSEKLLRNQHCYAKMLTDLTMREGIFAPHKSEDQPGSAKPSLFLSAPTRGESRNSAEQDWCVADIFLAKQQNQPAWAWGIPALAPGRGRAGFPPWISDSTRSGDATSGDSPRHATGGGGANTRHVDASNAKQNRSTRTPRPPVAQRQRCQLPRRRASPGRISSSLYLLDACQLTA